MDTQTGSDKRWEKDRQIDSNGFHKKQDNNEQRARMTLIAKTAIRFVEVLQEMPEERQEREKLAIISMYLQLIDITKRADRLGYGNLAEEILREAIAIVHQYLKGPSD